MENFSSFSGLAGPRNVWKSVLPETKIFFGTWNFFVKFFTKRPLWRSITLGPDVGQLFELAVLHLRRKGVRQV
jgi:hypothetical protein